MVPNKVFISIFDACDLTFLKQIVVLMMILTKVFEDRVWQLHAQGMSCKWW
jgi:hypothetical protein